MEYRKVYFRIRSRYQFDSGWPAETDAAKFHEESRSLFQSVGWDLQPGGDSTSDTVIKGWQELYLHPMNFSGIIISLPHPTSAKHPRMPLSDRAAQFAPFAALSGHSAALAETARLTDQRMELDEDARAALDLKQQLLLERIKERPEITVTWFQPDAKKDGGRYIVSTGRLKRIHEADQVLVLADGLRIPIGDIVELESECIRGLL